MKRITTTLAALGVAAGLAACSQKPEAGTAAAPEAAAPATAAAPVDKMADMNMAGDAKMAKSQGTVKAVDAKAGTMTLDHGPIPEANWPAMTMTFNAGPSVTSAAKVGEKVAFDVKLQSGASEVTAVQSSSLRRPRGGPSGPPRQA